MNITETSALLAMVAANDRRTVGETDIEVWHDALSDLPFADCQLAVRAYIRTSREWMTAFDVRDGVKRIVIRDSYVSRDHLRLEERPQGKVRIVNLSNKAPISIDGHSLLNPGADNEYSLPVRLGVGETTVDLSAPEPELIDRVPGGLYHDVRRFQSQPALDFIRLFVRAPG